METRLIEYCFGLRGRGAAVPLGLATQKNPVGLLSLTQGSRSEVAAPIFRSSPLLSESLISGGITERDRCHKKRNLLTLKTHAWQRPVAC